MSTQPTIDRSAVIATLRAQGLDPAEDIPIGWFGSQPKHAGELAALVCSGEKTATTGLLWSYEAEGRDPPVPGDLEVVVDWAGRPCAVLETISADIVAFEDVDAAHAREEGEGDGSLAYWRDVHWSFFERECSRLGRPPHPRMPVVCERFRRLWPAEEATHRASY